MNRWTRTAVISTYNYTRRRYLSTHQNQITRVEKIVRDSIEVMSIVSQLQQVPIFLKGDGSIHSF